MSTDPVWPQAVLDRLTGDRPVFEHGSRIVRADEMSALIRRAAAALRGCGIGAGDGVALHLGVTPEAFAATIAAFAIGARVAGVRPGLTGDQLQHLLRHNESVLIDDALLARLLAEQADDGVPLVAAGRPADIARITYTSGSTGNPKGCAQTYAAMTAAWAPYPDRWPPAIRELAGRLQRYLVFGSLASQVMIEYGILTLTAGGVLVVADPRPPGFAGMIERHRATASVITVGKLYQLIRDQRAHPADLSSLGALMVSGSPLDPGRLREAMEVLGPVIFHGYGQTETGMIAMVTPAEMAGSAAALASVGRPPAAVEVQIRDGEVYVRTAGQANSYWREPAETAEVFVDGWVRTRDLGSFDDHGYLRLAGRARDVIIVNANLVYAGPIERALAGHPDIAEAYVVGRTDERTGEAVHAFVVLRADRRPAIDELRAAVAQTLGAEAVPQTVTVIENIPIAPSGKPDKRALMRTALAEP